MATLMVTFSKHAGEPAAPVMRGDEALSYLMDVAENSDGDTVSSFSCPAGYNIVEFNSDVDCFVQLGAAPVAEVPTASTARNGFQVTAGVPTQRTAEEGQKVAVIPLV